jgi:hypothetical protein
LTTTKSNQIKLAKKKSKQLKALSKLSKSASAFLKENVEDIDMDDEDAEMFDSSNIRSKADSSTVITEKSANESEIVRLIDNYLDTVIAKEKAAEEEEVLCVLCLLPAAEDEIEAEQLGRMVCLGSVFSSTISTSFEKQRTLEALAEASGDKYNNLYHFQENQLKPDVKLDFKFNDNVASCIVGLCGHRMHRPCFDNFVKDEKEKSRKVNDNHFNGNQYFTCPMCKKLCNMTLTAMKTRRIAQKQGNPLEIREQFLQHIYEEPIQTPLFWQNLTVDTIK